MNDDGENGPPDALLDASVDDDVFRALREEPRRFVLYFLLEHDSATVERLADVVTGWVDAGTRGMATPQDRDRALTMLRHRDLPALEAAGLIDRDATGDVVSLSSLDAGVRELLEWTYCREGVTRTQPGPEQ